MADPDVLSDAFDEPDAALLETARSLVAGAAHVVVLTGAGISTDSGIRDFRGPNGVWTKNPEAEKLATIQVYLSDPDVRRQAWQRRMESSMWERQPNPGHQALADFEATGRLELVITQNVDGLHRAAGTSPHRLAEVHGNVREVVCVDCGATWPIAEIAARVDAGEEDPPCEVCGGIVKPAVVFFGEMLPEDAITRAFLAAEHTCDLFIAVGTSLGVYPVADTVGVALQSGARLIIVNGERTPYDSYADVVLRSSISATLPALLGG